MWRKFIYPMSFVLVLVLAGGAAAADPNIVGHWKFDEPSGTTVTDYSINGSNGTVYGGATLDGSGQLTLDGVDDYVSLPIGSLISSLTNSTFITWVDFSNAGGAWQRILDFGNNTSYYMFLCPRTGTTGPIRFVIKAGGGEQVVNSSETLPSRLHSVAVRIDADNDTATLFLDGKLQASTTAVTLSPVDLGVTTNNWLGRSQYSADAYFKGSYDEFRIYDYALSDAEIEAICHVPTPQATEPGPTDGIKTSDPNVTLSWKPGDYVQSVGGHDVYVGTNLSEVSNATRSNHPNVDYYNVDANSCALGVLAAGTYYWRVDEVNDPDIWKGDVWSFTVFELTAVFQDDFNEPRDYILEGVTGTGWDGFVGLGENETVDALNADISAPGQLYIESTMGQWQPGLNGINGWPIGPLLYKEVIGDFVATVKVSDYQDVSHNNCGIMARASIDPDEAGLGEDWVSIDYFPIWSCGNFVHQASDGGRQEVCHNGLAWNADLYLQLERVGNVFHFWTSSDGVNWTEIKCSPIVRDDFGGLALQVGLFQATYSENTGYVAFDDFVLDYTYVPRPYARAPYPKDQATSVLLDVDLSWTSGDSVQDVNGHEVYFGANDDAVADATRDYHPNVEYYIVSDPCCDVGQLEFGTQYFWRVDEVNEPNIWESAIWSFTTDTGKARNPGPRDGAIGVTEQLKEVRWMPSPYAVVQDFYFSTSFSDVNTGTTPDTSLVGTADKCSIPGAFLPLEFTRTYYWRVDTNNGSLPAKRGDVWGFTVAEEPAYNDITFFVTSDLHYNLDPAARASKWVAIDKMNSLPGTGYPAGVGGGLVRTPRGVMLTGDLTDAGTAEQWAEFTEDFGVKGEGRVYYPAYEACGNHDGVATYLGGTVRNGIKERNLARVGLTGISTNELHYSWDWDDVHFACMNIYAGTGDGDPNNYGNNAWNTPEDSLTFLTTDLAENVGDSGRPIVIYQHYGFDGFSTGWGWWTELERQEFYDVIKNYNVIGILWGHSHAVAMYTWNGINVYNCGSISGGFMVFHVTPDGKIIAVYRNKDTDTWGASSIKSIWIPPFCDYEDLAKFAVQWLDSGVGLAADFNDDGKVDFVDYSILASYWLDYCPADWPW